MFACALTRIHVTGGRHLDNNNPKLDIERIKRDVLENLRELAHTPSAHSSILQAHPPLALHPSLPHAAAYAPAAACAHYSHFAEEPTCCLHVGCLSVAVSELVWQQPAVCSSSSS